MMFKKELMTCEGMTIITFVREGCDGITVGMVEDGRLGTAG